MTHLTQIFNHTIHFFQYKLISLSKDISMQPYCIYTMSSTGYSMETKTYISTRISCTDAEELDRLVEAGMYMNRSDAIRTAVRQLIAA